MSSKSKLTRCCCWRWSNKSEDVSEDEKKENSEHVNIFSIEDEMSKIDDIYDETGNPRNKVALQPGHSLMDWIRLGTSGKDLTGFGPRAGNLSITKQELSKHNKRLDAWTSIRGKVYNITEYFPFHPGGEEELLKGAGIDATKLFDEVHPWVNYEQILQKCLIGKLVMIDPNIDTETLFFGEKRSSFTKSSDSNGRSENQSYQSNSLDVIKQEEHSTVSINNQTPALPRFDWIQKSNCITIIFYTKAFSNPFVEVNYPIDEQTVLITLTYDGTIFKNELAFHEKIQWPCDFNVIIETGKVELVFRKLCTGIWENYGVLRQYTNSGSNVSSEQLRSTYVLKRKLQINYNTWLLKFERTDRRKIVIPVGKHIRIFGSVNDQDISRSYTPVPECLFDNFLPHSATKENACFIIKRYSDGKMSRFVTDKILQEKIEFSKPFGPFELKIVEKRETFLLLAAGTGITPMLSLIIFLLERRIKKCQFLTLLCFNRTEKDIFLKNQFERLAQMDKRFRYVNILSDPSESWTSHRGHVTAELIIGSYEEHLKDTGYTIKDLFCFVCGPPKFDEVALQELKKVKISNDQVHVFEG